MKNWYYNPFVYIAGMKAFLIGLLVFALATFLGALNGTNFDGAFDVHLAKELPFSYYFIASFLSWIIPALFLYIGGIILSRSSIRFIDVLGTTGMARSPLLIMALIGFMPIASVLKNLNPMNPNLLGELMPHLPWLFIYGILSVTSIIWVIALLVNAYKVSCNLKGPKMVVSFILILIISEIVIKLLLALILQNIYHLPVLTH